ncbi:hypothetical protein DH2020_043102 [Rehmannia glutinosa]|uniref:Uncharacterized protein n=1 Tax=Rehmannia glutinosa TaxID=99300 RepID=A0ABR0UKM5_REHGL
MVHYYSLEDDIGVNQLAYGKANIISFDETAVTVTNGIQNDRNNAVGAEFSRLPFRSGEAPAPKPATNNVQAPSQKLAPVVNHVIPEKPSSVAPSSDAPKQIPAGIPGSQKNNYYRADGQNTGNFLTDRPSTKVHAAPGGGSSLGYLFGGGSN